MLPSVCKYRKSGKNGKGAEKLRRFQGISATRRRQKKLSPRKEGAFKNPPLARRIFARGKRARNAVCAQQIRPQENILAQIGIFCRALYAEQIAHEMA